MKKLVLSLIVISTAFLISCGGSENSKTENTSNNTEENVGEERCLDFAISEKYNTLDPINITSVVSFHIASQIYEPLLRFDEKDLTLQPLLAESWTVSEDKLIHTFKLKKGVFFHNNPCFPGGKGREVKAEDVAFTFKRIYAEKTSYAYYIFQNTIKGANDFEFGQEIEGLKVIDDYTVEFTLNKPSSDFLNLLAHSGASVVSKEAIEKDAIIGSGPFIYKEEHDTDVAVKLTRNTNYHISDKQGNKLPYLNSVAYNYVKSAQDQLDLFMNDKLDVITGIPPESIKDIVESQIADFQDKPVKYVLGRYPEVSTTFLNLNTKVAPFNNQKIRQAFGLAINKSKIVDEILKGEAYGPGNHGIVPSAIKNYDFSSIIGQEYDVAKAKKMLADAGFPDGKNFPSLKFATRKNNIGLRVALEIQKQLLSNLNINVEISSLQIQQIVEMNNASQVNLSLNSWLGEFLDPVTFLSLFYGENVPSSTEEPSFPNQSRYQNAKFDKLYEEALVTIDTKKRYELCLAADQIIATEVPVIPLWYHENYQLIQSVVKDYHPNSMNIQYLTYVKLEDSSSEE